MPSCTYNEAFEIHFIREYFYYGWGDLVWKNGHHISREIFDKRSRRLMIVVLSQALPASVQSELCGDTTPEKNIVFSHTHV